jgi:hypothetical protein
MAQHNQRRGMVRPTEARFGNDFQISPNEIFDADHPLVRKHPEWFTPVEPTRKRPAVEQATAAPGELR